MKNPEKIKKYLSTVLAMTMLAQSWPAHALSINSVPAVRRPLTLIQDIHAHVEAQKSIQETLAKLQMKKGRPLVVGVEGASGAFDFSSFQFLPDTQLTQAIADQLLEEGLVAGPVREGFLNPSFVLHGIEYSDLYIQNVEAYRQAAPLQKKWAGQLEQARHNLQNRKRAIFSSDLKTFDDRVESYRAGRSDLTDYIQALLATGVPSRFSLEIFQAARESETKLSLAAVEREKNRFVDDLARSLGSQELEWVKEWSASIEKSETNASRRFDTLLQAAKANGINTNKYPKLIDYVRYLKLAESVDASSLFRDASEMEKEAYARFAINSPDVEKLILESRRLYLAEKLIKFELSPEEWEEYKETSPSPSTLRRGGEFLPIPLNNKNNVGMAPAFFSSSNGAMSHNGEVRRGIDFSSFERFYALAEARNQAMARRVVETGADVLVVGGFHTPGLKALFERMGQDVDVLRPHVTKIDLESGSAYLNVFASQKTPLEKFLLKWKLFLAHPASLGVSPLVQTSHVSASDELLRRYETQKPGEARTVRRILNRLQSGARATSWVWETALLVPLAWGVAHDNVLLSGLGLLAAVPGLVLIHFWNDGFENWKARAAWATLLTGVFLAGWGALDSTVAGLASAALVHYLNHIAIFNPHSRMADLLFKKLSLPRVLMSAVPPVNENESGDYGDLEKEAKQKMAQAISTWRQFGDAKDTNEFRNRDTDAVTLVFDEFVQRALQSQENDKAVMAMVKGFSEAMRTLTPEEWLIRTYRDLMRGFDVAWRLTQERNQNFGILRMVQIRMNHQISELLANSKKLTQPQMQHITMGIMMALYDYPSRLVKNTMEQARANHADGIPDETFDVRFLEVWTFLGSECFLFSFGSDQMTRQAFQKRIEGAAAGFVASQPSENEITHRIATDMFNVMPGFGTEGRTGAGSFFPKVAESLIGTLERSSQDRARHKAAHDGLYLYGKKDVSRSVQALVLSWLSSPDRYTRLSPLRLWKDRFWKDMASTDPMTNERRPGHRDNMMSAARRGFSEALISILNLSVDDFVWLFETDLKTELDLLGGRTGSQAKTIQQVPQFLERALFSIEAYAAVASSDRTAGRFSVPFKTNLRDMLTNYVRSAIQSHIKLYTDSLQRGSGEFDFDTHLVYPLMAKVKELNIIDEKEISQLIAGAYLSSNLPSETLLGMMHLELDTTMENLVAGPNAHQITQVMLDAFEQIAQSKSDVPAFSQMIQKKLDKTEDFRLALEAYQSSSRGELDVKPASERIKRSLRFFLLGSAFLTSHRFEQIRQRMAEALMSAGLNAAALSARILTDMENTMGITIAKNATPTMRVYTLNMMNRAVLALLTLHRTLATLLTQAGQHDLARIVQDLIELRVRVLEEVSSSLGLPDGSVLNASSDWPTYSIELRTVFIFGMIQAYFGADLSAGEIKARIARDVSQTLRARVLSENGQPVNPLLMLDFVPLFAKFFPNEPLKVKAISEGMNEGLASSIESLAVEGIKKWREEKQDDLLIQLFYVVRDDLSPFESYHQVALKALVKAYSEAHFTPQEIKERASVDVAHERRHKRTNKNSKVAMDLYDVLLSNYSMEKTDANLALSQAVDAGLLGHYELSTMWEVNEFLDQNSPNPNANPYLGMEKQIETLLVRTTKNTPSDRAPVLELIAKGVTRALDGHNVPVERRQAMFRDHVASVVSGWFAPEADADNIFQNVLALHGSAKDEWKPFLIEGLVAGYRAGMKAKGSFLAPILQLRRKTGLAGIRMEEVLPSLISVILESEWESEALRTAIDAVAEPAFHNAFLSQPHLDDLKFLKKVLIRIREQSQQQGLVELSIGVSSAIDAWFAGTKVFAQALETSNETVRQTSLYRYAVLSKLDLDDGSLKKKMVEIFVGQSGGILSLREFVEGDVSAMFMHWANRQIDPTQTKLSVAVLQDTITPIVKLYSAVARHYADLAVPDHSKIDPIMTGLVNGLSVGNDVDNPDPWLGNLMLKLLYDHMLECDKVQASTAALMTIQQIKRRLMPGEDALRILPYMELVAGRSRRRLGRLDGAVKNGLDPWLAMSFHQYSSNSTPIKKWATFFENLLLSARIHLQLGHFELAQEYFKTCQSLLVRYPILSTFYRQDLQNVLQGLLSVARIQLTTDSDQIKIHLAQIESSLLPLLDATDMPEQDKEQYRLFVLQSYARACRSGTEESWDQFREIMNRLGQSIEGTTEGILLKGEAVSNLILARGATQREGVYLQGLALVRDDESDLQRLLTKARIAAAYGNDKLALELLTKVHLKLKEASNGASISEFLRTFLQKQTYLLMVVIVSNTDSQSSQNVLTDALRGLARLHDHAGSAFEDLGYLYPRDNMNVKPIVQAVDGIVMDKSATALGVLEKLRLVRMVSQLAPEEMIPTLRKKWADRLRTIKISPDNASWSQSLDNLVKTHIKREIETVFENSDASAEKIGPAWPRHNAMGLDFVRKSLEFDRQFKKSLEETDSDKWRNELLTPLRMQIQYEAGVWALAGFAKESEQWLQYSYQLAVLGYKHFKLSGGPSSEEDRALIVYPARAGDVVLALSKAGYFVTELIKKYREIPEWLFGLLLDNALMLSRVSFPKRDDRVRKAHEVRDIVAKAFEKKGGNNPNAFVALARLSEQAGDFAAAREHLLKGGQGRLDIAKATQESPSAVIVLAWVPYLLNATSVPLANRLRDVRALLQAVDFHDGLEMIFAYEELANKLMSSRGDLEALKDVCLTYSQLLLTQLDQDQMPLLLRQGLPIRVIETAFLLGASTEQSQTLISRLVDMKSSWTGPEAETFLANALEFYQALTSSAPETYLDWAQGANIAGFVWPGHANALRLTATYYAGKSKDEFKKIAFHELVRFVTDKPKSYSDELHDWEIVTWLMRSPLAREAFIETCLDVFQNYDPNFWNQNFQEQRGVDVFRRILKLAAHMGDPRIVMAYDALLANKKFTLRDSLEGKDGWIEQAEPSLTLPDWRMRLANLPEMTPTRFEALSARARSALGGTDEVDVLLREAAEKRSAEQQIKTQIAQAQTRFEVSYKKLDFAQARADLLSVAENYWPHSFHEAMKRLTVLSDAWTKYQAMDYAGALSLLETITTDTVADLLKNRVRSVEGIYSELSAHHPQAAKKILEAIPQREATVSDPLLQTTEHNVGVVLERLNSAFEKIEKLVKALPDNPNSLGAVQAAVKGFRGRDLESERVMMFLVEQARICFELRLYPLSQDILRTAFLEAGLWDMQDYGPVFKDLSEKAETLRKLARAAEMGEWIKLQHAVLRSEMDALAHLEVNGVNGEAKFRKKLFQTDASWSVAPTGMLAIPAIFEVQPSVAKDSAGKPVYQTKRIDKLADMGLSAGLNFLLTMEHNGVQVRIPLVFIRTSNFGSGGEQLNFQADSHGLEQLKKIALLKTKPAGTLVYLQDQQIANQAITLERTLQYLDAFAKALQDKKPLISPQPILERLLGLNIDPQKPKVDLPLELSPIFQSDESQQEAIQAALLLPVVGIQGPPGTGKTTTTAEAYKHAVSKLSAEQIHRAVGGHNGAPKGDIVVLTAQAHAGVDNMAFKLLEKNVAIVRSASQQASVNIASRLKGMHESRLNTLWGLIQRHHTSGEGFAYLATNSGLAGDWKCLSLLQMYLNGVPMNEVEIRYRHLSGTAQNKKIPFLFEKDSHGRSPHRPIWAQEEAGQANTPETLLVYFAISPSRCCFFGDHYQLPPHGVSEWTEKIIREAMQQGYDLSSAQLKAILSEEALEALSTSLFEVSYNYAQTWGRTVDGKFLGGNMSVHFLQNARRSHWLITSLVNLFYSDRLQHRDQKKPREEWAKTTADTVLIISTDGEERGGGADELESASTSKRNFREAGEVIRTISYFLNVKNPKSGKGQYFQPSDLLILTPYKAQNELINESLKLVAILNDLAKGAEIKTGEIDEMIRIVRVHSQSHSDRAWKIGIEKILNEILRRPLERAALAGRLFEALKPLYNLYSDEDRKISRDDVHQLFASIDTNGTGGVAAHIHHLEENMRDNVDDLEKDQLEGKTVHRVQGQEKPVVILSLVRTEKAGFLGGKSGDRILNVAISRAQHHLAIVTSQGNPLIRLKEIIKRWQTLHPGAQVLSSAPSHHSDSDAPPASLRHASGWSTGNPALDRDIDVYAMPALETVVFLSMLAMGLTHGDIALIAMGVVMKALVFPALHVWLAPNMYQWKREFSFSTRMTAYYLLSWLVLVTFAPGFSVSEIAAMAPVALAHFHRNSKADAAGDLRNALPVQRMDVDTLNGAPALLESQIPTAAPVRLPKANELRFAGSRA